MSTQAITDSNFEANVLKGQGTILVDFWAEWCGPCRALGPKLEEISNEMGEKVQIMKIDVDQNQTYAAKYNVKGIPKMIIFKDGQLVDQLEGNQPKETIVATLQKYI